MQWFQRLSAPELRTLLRRANHRLVPRWSTIIREGAVGSIFYVLLKGSVRVTNNSGVDVVLPAGVSFGEGALVTKVRREATVTAIEPCHLVQLTASACKGLGVDLDALRAHVISHMLAKVRFFAHLEQHRRAAVAQLLDVTYLPERSYVFEEGDPGDKFYILIEGRITIYQGKVDIVDKAQKRTVVDSEDDEPVNEEERAAAAAVVQRGVPAPFNEGILLGEFCAEDQYPWFGEMALFDAKSRGATALGLEPCKLLSLDRRNMAAFFQIVPSFAQMFATSATAYTNLNKLKNVMRKGEQGRRQRKLAREAADVSDDTAPEGSAAEQAQQALRRGSGVISHAIDMFGEMSTAGDSPPDVDEKAPATVR